MDIRKAIKLAVIIFLIGVALDDLTTWYGIYYDHCREASPLSAYLLYNYGFAFLALKDFGFAALIYVPLLILARYLPRYARIISVIAMGMAVIRLVPFVHNLLVIAL